MLGKACVACGRPLGELAPDDLAWLRGDDYPDGDDKPARSFACDDPACRQAADGGWREYRRDAARNRRRELGLPALQYDEITPSFRYTALLGWVKKFHAENKVFTGERSIQSFTPIYRLCRTHEAKTLLDYGCGKGRHFKLRDHDFPYVGVKKDLLDAWGVNAIYGYEPGVPEYDFLPEFVCDGVYATDVLEYVPPEDLDWVLDAMFSRARKFVFAHTGENLSTKMPEGLVELWPGRTTSQWLEAFVRVAKCHPDVDWVCEVRPAAGGRPVPWRRDRGDGCSVDRSVVEPIPAVGLREISSEGA